MRREKQQQGNRFVREEAMVIEQGKMKAEKPVRLVLYVRAVESFHLMKLHYCEGGGVSERGKVRYFFSFSPFSQKNKSSSIIHFLPFLSSSLPQKKNKLFQASSSTCSSELGQTHHQEKSESERLFIWLNCWMYHNLFKELTYGKTEIEKIHSEIERNYQLSFFFMKI